LLFFLCIELFIEKDQKDVEAEKARKAAMEAQASAPKPGGRRRKR